MAYKPIGAPKSSGYVPIGAKPSTPAPVVNTASIPLPSFTTQGSTPQTTTQTTFGAIKDAGKQAGKISTAVVQGTGRGALAVGPAIASLLPGETAKRISQTPVTPLTDPISKFAMGTEPVTIQSEGVDPLKGLGLSDKNANRFAAPFIIGSTLMDAFTGGGKKEALIKSIKAVEDINDARKVLKGAGIPEDVIFGLKLDGKAVAAKTDEAVLKLLKEAIPEVAPLPKLPVKPTAKVAEDVPIAPIVKSIDNTPVSPIAPVVKTVDNIPTTVSKLEVSPVPTVKLSNNTVESTRRWISNFNRRDMTPNVLQELASAKIVPSEPVTLYRVGKADDTTFQSWSKVKPTVGDFITKTFTPEQILLDTTDPRFISQIPADGAEGVSKLRSLENEVIIKPASMVSETKSELPALPKLSPEMVTAIKSNQANEVITKALNERYSAAARRPVREDIALAKAAKEQTGVVNAVKDTGKATKKIAGVLFTPISSRLRRINPILKRELRKFEYSVSSKTAHDSSEILPILDATKKMSPQDQALFDLAQKNQDIELIDAFAAKYGIEDEINRARDVLDDLHERGRAVGMFEDGAYRKNYWPRMVINPEKYLAYLRGTEDWGLIQRLLDNAATAKGLKVTDLTAEEQATLVNNLIRGYGDKVTLAKPGFTKARTIEVIDEKLNEFYESSNSALSAYVVRMNDEIEARKFFGKASKDPEIGSKNIQDSIGAYVLDLAAKGEIKPDQIQEVNDILKSRFHRGKMNAGLDVYRNAEYISTMGSPISAITQIGDLAFSLYENGFWNTAKGLGKSITDSKRLTKEALGIEQVTQEFTKNTMSGKALDRVFKLTGLSKMDSLGKETLVNGYLSKLQKQARANDEVLTRELEFMFDPEEAALAKKELANGELTERTKLMAFNKLLDYQPVAKSEMPQKYLEMPNGRIFYTLKSYTLKQIDIFRSQAIDDIVSGDRTKMAKGMKNLLLLSGSLVAANATADEIKDTILGRSTPMSDKVVDNLWRLVGASKYDVYKARQDGVGVTVAKKLLFPTSLTDRVTKDISNIAQDKRYEKGPLKGERFGLESTQSIPIGGKLYYWWFGRGAQKEEYKQGSSTSTTPQGLPALPKLPKLPKLPALPKAGG